MDNTSFASTARKNSEHSAFSYLDFGLGLIKLGWLLWLKLGGLAFDPVMCWKFSILQMAF